MSQQYTVAIAGATGAVGIEMIRTLEQRKFPVKKLRLLASERSIGKKLKFHGADVVVEELTENSFKGIELALFSAGAERSRTFAPAAVSAGAVVVDNSSAFRMDDTVPLVVPEVNPQEVAKHRGIIANPNCSTIIALVPLWPLHKAAKITRLVAATYQAVSGTGAKAIDELEGQVRAWAAGQPMTKGVYPHQIAFNVLPQVGPADASGYTQEEKKLLHETRKIFGDGHIRVSATCVRVPVFRSHSEALFIETEKKLTAAEAKAILAKAPGVILKDDVNANQYPMPIEASGHGEVIVGRLREDSSCDKGLALWVAGDQLLKGAALNAVQIAEILYGIKR
ncbi:MAG TPA: aspartate-semialdehyde dehydrogenase [Planctomycetota bacterium]|nr:aspartate-semialdehyde dehydrogenase [Planctomycetota bacterium]